MTILFWTLVVLVGYAYAGYPLLLCAIAALRRRPVRRDPGHEPAVSLLIPAYNEEEVIAAKLENALALDYPRGKIQILVTSESDDGTNGIVARYEDRGVRLIASSERRGKAANLARAVPHATGEILVFTDANAMFRPDALRCLVRNFADPGVGAVSGRLVYTGTGRGATASGEETYWGFEMILKRASSALGSLPGANGSIFALRRELYAPIDDRRGDDFELPIRVILQGRASILDPDAVSHEPAAAGFRDEFRRKVRIINWMSTSAVLLLREAVAKRRFLIAFQLLSHKLNRWAVPFWLLGLLPASLWLAAQGPWYAAAAWSQGALYLAAVAGWGVTAAGRRLPGVLLLPFYFVVVNAAALVGLVTAALGREVSWHRRGGG